MRKELKKLTIDELQQLTDQIEKDPDKIAGLLFPENLAGRTTLIKQIGQWAINQTVVLESNHANKIDLAIIFNKVGERIWQQLPSFAKDLKVNVYR